LNFRFDCAIGHVGALGASWVGRVLFHPVVFDGRADGGGRVGLVVHPAEPFGGDHGAVVIVSVLLRVNHPPVAGLKIVFALVVLVPVLVLTDKGTVLKVVSSFEGLQSTHKAAMLIYHFFQLSPPLAQYGDTTARRHCKGLTKVANSQCYSYESDEYGVVLENP